MGVEGLPDVICIIPGGFILGLELKGAKGRASESQLAMQKFWRGCNAAYEVVRSMDEVICALKTCIYEYTTRLTRDYLTQDYLVGSSVTERLNILKNNLHEATGLLQQAKKGESKGGSEGDSRGDSRGDSKGDSNE